MNIFNKIIFSFLIASVFSVVEAKDVADDNSEVVIAKSSKKEEVKSFINHHLKDSYGFNLFSYTNDENEEVHIGLPLPIIIWDKDSGLSVFMSSKFHHGETSARINDNYYKLYHNKIYKTNSEGLIKLDEHNHPINAMPLDFSITKNIAMIFLVALFMLLLFRNLAKSYSTNGGIPTGLGRFLEPIIIYIRDEIAIPNIGEKHYKKYMSYLLTIFFFVWFLNLFGLTPLGVNVTGNITVTLSLSLITYFITTFTANKNYWTHIFWMPGVPKLMRIVLAPIELLGTFIKPFSLMIRLYANMVAGHVVLMSIIGLVFLFKNILGSSLSFGLAFFLSILELLVALLQAYIFTMLSALYFGSAVEEHGGDH